MYSTGNIINNTIIIFMVADGYQSYSDDHFVMYKNIKSLCSIPETNIIMYVDYTSVKNVKALGQH